LDIPEARLIVITGAMAPVITIKLC